MQRLILGAAALLVTATAAGAQQRSTDRSFRWDGAIPSGAWLYVRNLNGAVRVERATGGQAEIVAEKSWRRGNPEEVRIEVRKVGNNDVLVCALWTEQTECDEDGYRVRSERNRWRNDRENDVAVEFTVRLPAGVRLDVSTVNGELDVSGASSVVEASTVNGSIAATSSGGPVNANTVNGSIEVRMGRVGDSDLSFETVNGSIEVYVPDGLDADVDMRTVNGSVGSDFPLTVTGRINPRRIRATLGKGGRRIELKTVNGQVELRKS